MNDTLKKRLSTLSTLTNDELQKLDSVFAAKQNSYLDELANNLVTLAERQPNAIAGYQSATEHIASMREVVGLELFGG